MNRFPILIALIGALTLLPASAMAQRVSDLPSAAPEPGGPLNVRIAAVVNDNIVTTADLESRIRLSMIGAGLPETSEVAHRLMPQVLRSLIDEQLEMQEAKRLGITVPDSEVDQALDRIAQDNNIPQGMKTYVSAHGVSPDVLMIQIRDTLTWNKVIQRELRPQVDVGEDEVDAAIARMRANAGKEEYAVSEIFLAVDNPQDEEQVHQFADNLVQQLKSGTNFGAVAHQFSQSAGAAQGGDIGWVQEGQLAPELNKALMSMQKGDIAGPIRSASGFHILGLREKRTITLGSDAGDITLSLQELFHPFDAAGKDAVMQQAGQMHTAINSCSNLQNQLEKFPGWHAQDMGEVKRDKIPGWALDKVRDLQTGQTSDALATDKGALVFVVCDRHVPEGNIDRNAIMNSIGTEKLELQARRLLRDLRRNAYLDVKLASSAPPS